MKLSQLLSSTPIQAVSSNSDPEVTSLAYDSRQVTCGGLFFALEGEKSDGNRFISNAVENGAVAIVSQSRELKSLLPVAKVENARIAMADIAAAFYSQPSRSLKVAAVTGTNGKTTTAFLIRHLCSNARLPCGLIGTVLYDTGSGMQKAIRTTPEAPEVQEMLAQMRDNGLRACVLEASSHASISHRLHAIEFDTFVFTNLTQDHLDFHSTFDAYFNAKAAFFERLPAQTKNAKAIINTDDRYGHLLMERLRDRIPVIRYGVGANADFRASDVRFNSTGTTYQLKARNKSYFVRLPLIGLFNVYNSLAALATASSLGLELRAAVAGLATSPQVPGRMERVAVKRSFQVFVDYAHTEDALRNALHTLKQLNPSRLIVVFGCGGNRDRTKRPAMARAAEELADWTILTSDNPRKEDPAAIIADATKGFSYSRHESIIERENAIRHAVALAKSGDILLIAGKGHEKYQEFADSQIPFDDVAVAARVIAEKPVEA
ncbi:MAG: UDP-N-acetylmuramoyl-L-alanyl-D-glutamate--2,6-diaminopimelate ligase [Verrucomicrobia bacterium]|nr:MAG: UDP-N-acetylmuramoyl-L-alanyl-D-glutamate--2,6-diaminopimelate ligase [Verrucomicrobiota bacterium]